MPTDDATNPPTYEDATDPPTDEYAQQTEQSGDELDSNVKQPTRVFNRFHLVTEEQQG
ncbi:hypothetical protein [Nocardia sp. NPDC006630]|uniref:hypothetical protein n=1 Tax=Nocardia sp. NPDC006630 TaxID=3157181 RepID=UPI0033A2CEE0